MAVQNKDLPRFSIVSQSPRFTRLSVVLAVFWLALAMAWLWLLWRGMDTDAAQLREQRDGLKRSEALLKQELANAKRAEFITRSANTQIQESLAEKDEQIAGLRADMDFYERLVGSGGRRHGLSVHNAEFSPGAGNAWRYTITLTQNLNRGGLTSGQMQFAVDGVSGGKLKTLNWSQLLQKPEAPAQDFSFRYFQQIEGDVMLPLGFTPQRVRVSVSGGFGKQEQRFDWTVSTTSTQPDL
ncbi:DUF6776 family protein [Arenimonas sp.]|jgi:hypothetical protein|uniref:DUF6776 family protein n=1 Tax=Arenimonas sp. TaxID=1872635 RepID=UPI0037C173C8